MKRAFGLFACGLLILPLLGATLGAQNASAQIRPTERPFLWRIEGPVPSYLYGTVHVPDPRVLELPEVVRNAFNASDVFNAEIPLDAGTQASLLGKIMLPPGQDLRKIAGEEVFGRLAKVIAKVLGSAAPPGVADILASTMAGMKPWAVMSQIELLEFFPDIAAGRQPLDAMLYAMAEKAGKELGALETVEDQLGVFEAFTNEEQIKMLVASMDDIEKPEVPGLSPTQKLIALYLAGDLDKLAGAAYHELEGDPALDKKVMARLVHDRNTAMTAKIVELTAKKPVRSHFFAVGALHYAGDTGIVTQLAKKGIKVTRLGPNDAKSIVRKPAA
jgi:uncharacterized protein